MATSGKDSTSCNPVEETRRGLGLTRRQLAFACGLSYYTVAQIERGLIMKLPEKIRRFFAGAGVDVEALEHRNATWRERQSHLYAERFLGSYALVGAPSLRKCVSELEGLLRLLGQPESITEKSLEGE